MCRLRAFGVAFFSPMTLLQRQGLSTGTRWVPGPTGPMFSVYVAIVLHASGHQGTPLPILVAALCSWGRGEAHEPG